MSEPCCGRCRHWYRIGPAPAPSVPVLLSAQDAPVAGQCRLHLVTLMRPDGMCQSMYGQVVASFPACSHFDARANGVPS